MVLPEWLQRTIGGTDVTGRPTRQAPREYRDTLENLGFLSAHRSRCARTAFPGGLRIRSALTADGIDGPLTRAALTSSEPTGSPVRTSAGMSSRAPATVPPARAVAEAVLIWDSSGSAWPATPPRLLSLPPLAVAAPTTQNRGRPRLPAHLRARRGRPTDADRGRRALKTFGGIGYSSAYRVVTWTPAGPTPRSRRPLSLALKVLL